MITKLLIANRGEIACRIMRTARSMGIATVAVYSDADAKALHVRQADEAMHIGPSPAADSYLRGDRIIAAAKQTGADAIHPGYGFLSENADFARAVIAAGLIWVGPRPESIEAMGLKDAAKKLMRAAGVPVTPGYEGEDQSVERLQQEAEAIGYPVLIKAVAGGGGKGMRKVDAPEDFAAMLESCRREAKASFSNDEVLLEKWITSPRHIEVQVFGDSLGNVVHLFERDCSLQRRHQKVIEEAPAPGMDEATREAICAAAVRAAQAVDYEGAGTIEFIADASEGLRADRIFFMEMNTRLQVEHPVTEEITGVDLVEWQLRVASGEPLPLRQEELSIDGWAIEARIYAEDPAKGFLPVIGTVGELQQNQSLGWGIRLDTAVVAGDEVTPFYDPMIAKVIAKGRDRDEVREELLAALGGFTTWPLGNNASFLYRLVSHPIVAAGETTTAFIGEHLDELTQPEPMPQALRDAAATALFARLGQDQADTAYGSRAARKPWTGLRGFRLNREPSGNVTMHDGNQSLEGSIGGNHAHIPHWSRADGVLLVERGTSWFVRHGATRGTTGHSAHDGDITAPMPGKVIAVDVAQGDTVEAGQRLLVLEAMKMEHALTAPFAGTVAELSVSAGDQVQVEALLAVVEPGSKE